jgi:hypothetical protein
MTAPADAVIDILYRARCKLPGCGWHGKEHTHSEDAHTERRLHLLTHITADFAPKKGGGKR